MKCKCDNCGDVIDFDAAIALTDIVDLGQRLDEGSVVPHGECPSCGAFVYKYDEKTDPEKYPYPEHLKLEAIRDQSQKCGEFLDWLEEKDLVDVRSNRTMTSLLADFFEIDENKLEEEKRAMIDACRKMTEAKETKIARED